MTNNALKEAVNPPLFDPKNSHFSPSKFNTDFNSKIRHLANSDLINRVSVPLDSYRVMVTGGVISYVDGLIISPVPTLHNSKWNCGGKSAQNLVESVVSEFKDYYLSEVGGQFRYKSYSLIINQLLANLLYAEKKHCQLLVSRDKNKSSKAFVLVCDYFLSHGLSLGVKGCHNEYQAVRSWMIPTSKLLNMAKREDIKIRLAKNTPMVVVRDAKKKEVKLKLTDRNQLIEFNRLGRPVQQLNEVLLNHVISLPDGREFNCFSNRVFNLSRLDLGGRFYGGDHLSLKKCERKQLLIDGVKTVEPDFKSLHITMLYAWEGIQLDPLESDPYTISGFDRLAVKLALLIMVNSKRLQDVKASITFSAKQSNIDKYNAYKVARAEYEKELVQHTILILKGKKTTRPIEPKRPFKIYKKKEDDQGNTEWKSKGENLFIPKMPVDTDGKKLVEAILKEHKDISDHFGSENSENLGLKLQYQDSQIMAATIQQLAAINIPCLPVHDSLRCKVSDCDAVMDAMNKAYKAVTGFNGCVVLD